MDVAAMNVRIMFQKNEAVSDAIGNHTDTWADYYSCHATISDSLGKSSAERVPFSFLWESRNAFAASHAFARFSRSSRIVIMESSFSSL